MQGQRKALYSWLVYEDAGFLPISNANCDLKLGQATVMLVFHCWLLHTSYQSYMFGKIYYLSMIKVLGFSRALMNPAPQIIMCVFVCVGVWE